ncbi:hypothetical protein [Thiohalophilus thiocyanatoxydans]|uniref:Uncharacterized protein n=1 Tax=Thiohalophilus thiocyanatoxydans TaxID=381308 RepID=A0A4V3H4R6_9GAMM|nr:hypothetical protein [Thiohalophilus thiocyanatoxydans]TDY04215.1 hypothetical protein EDC23_0588 [Thiohalophilus thiocyanatoxydans]
MPGTIHWEYHTDGVLLTMTGLVSGREIITLNRQIYTQDPQKKLRYQIWDFTGANRMEVSPDELHTITLEDKDEAAQNPGQLVALVGSPRQLNGVDISYQIFSQTWVGDGFQSESFRTLREARQWIEHVLSSRFATPIRQG